CNTVTRFSLQCMFTRPEGTIEHPASRKPILMEKSVFSVFKKLGFTLDLFATQGELSFYHYIQSDFYKFRETFAAAQFNLGMPLYDMLLVPDLKQSIINHPKGKHIIVLHTMGSHYLYATRYPRSFARFKPECLSKISFCTNEQLINAYDNTIVYMDAFIKQTIDQLRDKKAI